MPENTEILGIEIRGKENVSDSAKKAEASLKDLLKAAEEARSAIKSIQGSNLAEVGKSAENAKTKVNGLTQAMKAQKKANMEALEAYKREAKESAKAEREQTAARIKQADKEYEVERNLKKNIEAHVASIQSSRDFSNIKMPTYGDSTKKMLSQMRSQINQAKEMATQAEAVRTAPFAVMARNAYSNADLTTLQGMQDFKSKLTSIKGYQDMASARTAVADAMKSGDISSAIKAMNQLEDAEKRTTQATKELDKAQKDTSSSAQKMSSSHKGVLGTLSNLFSSLKRIAKLRLLRGIIRGITQSISEGTANLYQYSAAMNGADSANFSGNMDMMASLLAQLTNAIGTVAGQLMANLAPALSTIANWFITAANAAAQFLAALGGRATYTRAKTQTKAWKDVGGAVGGATAAAKEYKNTIMGFDEINALNDQSSGGGGGGGGGASAPDYSDMFEEVPLERTGLMGALNRLGELLHPILEELGNEIEMWVDSTVSMIEGGIDIIDGLLNNDKEKIKQGIEEVQHAFEENPVFRIIGDRVFTLAKMINDTINGIRKSTLEVIAKILDGMSFINPAFGDAADQVRAWNDQLDENKDLQDKILELTKRMSYGEFGYEGYEAALKLINQQLPDLEYNARRVVRQIDLLRSSGKLTKDALLDLSRTNPTFKALLESTGDVDKALQDILDGSIECKDGILQIGEVDIPVRTIDELNKVSNAAYETQKRAENTRKKIQEIGTANMNPYRLSSDFGIIQRGADNATSSINGTKDSVNIFDRLRPSFQLTKDAFSGVTTKAGEASGGIYGTQSAVNTMNNMYPGFNGIDTGLHDIGWWADDSAARLWNMKGVVDQIDGSTVHIYAGTKFGGGGGSFAKGGYVGNFANGGIIPSFADGGIRTADIFAANENGIPELIGRIGNRTAVANQGQMVDVLADGVFRALAPLFSGGQANTEVNVYMDNEVVARAAERGKQALNRRFNVSLA